jgi:cephalosporin hydroxylase
MLNFCYSNSPLWQMSPAERICFDYICESSEGVLAVEIGSYCGGSLNHLARAHKKVYSVDIDHKNLVSIPPNVHLFTGDSRRILPNLIRDFNRDQVEVSLFHIDGNHEYEYVLSDLNNVLKYKPVSQYGVVYILLHDSWYKPTRQAIIDSDVTKNLNVHFVDTDFCNGVFIDDKKLMGGLALIEMRFEERTEDLVIKQSSDLTYRKMQA